MTMHRRVLAKALVGGVVLATVPIVRAQSPWPTRPVRIVIPMGAGGSSDVTARLIAQDLSTRWGQQVIVDNKPGGDTVIAASEVQRAAPDGYTLLMTLNSTLTLTPHTMSKVPYVPSQDFSYVGQLTEAPLLVLVNSALPVKTFAEFVEYARARPGQLNAAGAATLTQLLTEQVSHETGIKLTWVMYKSGAEITKALLSNEVEFGVDAVINNLPHVQSGKLRALAVTSKSRLASLPDVPTLQEVGIKSPLVTLQHVMLGPRGLQPAVLSKIQRDVQVSMSSASLREKLLDVGIQSSWITGAELLKSLEAESVTTADLVRKMGLKPQ